jgi:hypothetical protein
VSSPQLNYAQERRSTRIDHAMSLTVQGVDALRTPYVEKVSTLTISCHGCRYQSNNEVLLGDVVCLEVVRPDDGRSMCSSRARVKWVQPLVTRDMLFDVALELESPGNIWGVAPPPGDWFPVRELAGIESANSGRELRVVARTELQMVPTSGEAAQLSDLERNPTAASLSPFLAQLMVGLDEQIQRTVSQAATAVIVKEKRRLLDGFLTQLREEATHTLECVISTSKEELARRTLSELSEAHEAAAQTTYERWMKKIDQDMRSAAQRILAQGTAVSERVENMAVNATERLQRNMDASRREAVDRFLSRLQDRLSPLLGEVQAAAQELAASEDELTVKALAMCEQFETFVQRAAHKSGTEMQERISGLEKQVESSVNERLANVHNELDKHSTAAADEGTQALRKFSQGCEQAAQSQLESVVASATDQMTQITRTLKDRTGEISRQFSSELESYVRSYLEFVGNSIAETAKKTAIKQPPGLDQGSMASD